MTRFDLIVLLVLAVSGGIGWFRGGLREAVTLVAIAGGFLAVHLFGETVTSQVGGTLRKLISLGVVFLAGDLIVSGIGSYVVRRFVGAKPGRNDKIAGGFFGVVRGWVLAAFMLFTVEVYHEGAAQPGFLADSLFAPMLGATVDAFVGKADVSVTELSNRSR